MAFCQVDSAVPAKQVGQRVKMGPSRVQHLADEQRIARRDVAAATRGAVMEGETGRGRPDLQQRQHDDSRSAVSRSESVVLVLILVIRGPIFDHHCQVPVSGRRGKSCGSCPNS